MTREDAIKRLKLWLICSEEYSESDVSMNDAIRVAINSLEIDERYELEYEQIEPCEDAISRADVRHLIAETNRKDLGCMSTKAFKILYDGIDALLPVTPQPKTGHWEWVKYDDYPICGDWVCSKCKSVTVQGVREDDKGGIPLYKYCPECGAKMAEEVQDDK